jgi:hypothetical protein
MGEPLEFSRRRKPPDYDPMVPSRRDAGNVREVHSTAPPARAPIDGFPVACATG